MNSLLRSVPFQIHRYIEIPLLLKWARLQRRLSILEIGCGSGEVARHLFSILRPKNYIATDIDPKTIAQAEKANPKDSPVIFQVADVRKLPFEKNSFDVVIEFNTLHHVSNWKKGVDEIQRVLKPKGRLLMRDSSIETYMMPLVGYLMRQFLDRPYAEMFDQREFMSYLRYKGFQITHMVDRSLLLLLAATLVKKSSQRS